MRNLLLFGLILLLLTLNGGATGPVQLNGTGGHAILARVASTNITTNLTNASANDLWNWGTTPMNYALNDSGMLYKLAESPSEDRSWLETIKHEILEFNSSEYE